MSSTTASRLTQTTIFRAAPSFLAGTPTIEVRCSSGMDVISTPSAHGHARPCDANTEKAEAQAALLGALKLNIDV